MKTELHLHWIIEKFLICSASFVWIMMGYWLAIWRINEKFEDHGYNLYKNKISRLTAYTDIYFFGILPVALAFSGILSVIAPPYVLNISILGFLLMFPAMVIGVEVSLNKSKKAAKDEEEDLDNTNISPNRERLSQRLKTMLKKEEK